jgi:hypothetical protein
MAETVPPTPSTPDADAATPRHPIAASLTRAIRAHPILRDQKKLVVKEAHGTVRLEGAVFTQDMLRQLHELVARVPGAEAVRILVEAEVKAPQPRAIVGRVPEVSPGPSNVDRAYSVRRPPRRR